MYKFCFLWVYLTYLFSNSLQFGDINIINEKLFEYHVLFDSFNKDLASRSMVKIVQSFDPAGFYFLEEDMTHFQSLSSKITKEYNNKKFDSYISIRDLFEKRVKGLRKIRTLLFRQIISGKVGISSLQTKSKSYPPLSQEEQRENLLGYVGSYVDNFMEKEGKKTISKEEMLKVLSFLERRFKAHESKYLSFEKYPLFLAKMIASSLDAHSMIFDNNEIGKINARLKSKMTGIGIYVMDGIDGPYIRGCIKGGPADKSSKVSPGDKIAYINGIDSSILSYEKVMNLLSVKEGQTILLQLESKAGKKKVVKLTGEKIQIQKDRIAVELERFLDGYIATLRVDSFYNDFENSSISLDMKKVLKKIEKEAKIYGVILDLRKNLGGFFKEAVKCIDMFTDKGTVVVAKFRNDEVRFSREYNPHKVYGGPLVILTSKYSASASEILAQSLQDVGAAVIAGDEATYGKGSIQFQTITDPSSVYKYKVTVGKYYTVSGVSTQLKGVYADVLVPSEFSRKNIGEKYLTFALPADNLGRVGQMDPDIKMLFDYQNRRKKTAFEVMKPHLKRNSEMRIEKSKNYQAFLASLSGKSVAKNASKKEKKNALYGKNDLQVMEACAIIKDMHFLLESYKK